MYVFGNNMKLLGLALAMLIFSLSACEPGSVNHGKVDPDFEWVTIQGGTFLMGSPDGQGMFNEHPQHKETLGAFEILKTEVTVAQYQKCVDEKVCWETLKPDNDHYCNYGKADRLKHPVNCVDWYQASTFCAWTGGRLPSEAEWEYVARSGGKDYKYVWGNDTEPSCEYAVMDTPEGIGCGAYMTWEICSKPKGNTEQGVCDMSGNVIEWINDWYYLSYQPDSSQELPPDITNMKNGQIAPNRVMRGAGIGSDEDYRTRNRIYHDPHFQYGGLGIRCVRDI